MLHVPNKYAEVQQNFLPVAPELTLQKPFQTPQVISQPSGHFSVPPPPIKKRKTTGTDAVRSLFGNPNSAAPTHAGTASSPAPNNHQYSVYNYKPSNNGQGQAFNPNGY